MPMWWLRQPGLIDVSDASFLVVAVVVTKVESRN